MARKKTSNVPDLNSLLVPQNPIMVAVEHVILRRHAWSSAAAPVAEQIAVRIAGVITMDLIHAGQRLLEQDISQVLRVSRAPVREALRILEREQLVEFQARRGTIVTAPDAKDIADIYAVRIALIKILLRQLMARRPADLEAVFERHMPTLVKAVEQGSVDGYALGSFLLNTDMVKLTAGRLIGDLLSSISLRTLRYVRLAHAADPSRMVPSLQTWRDLHRAVASRDVDEVLATATRRIEDSRDSAVRAVVAEPPQAAPAPVNHRSASGPAQSQPSAASRKSSAPPASRLQPAVA